MSKVSSCYDPLGRRALVQDNGATTLRTLYDGLGCDVLPLVR